MPYNTWPYPDDVKGPLQVLGNSRTLNKIKGLFDYRPMRNVHIIAASEVGGGSLVYANVTEKPVFQVYQNWPTQLDGESGLETYFDLANRFIGVNPITTTASVGRFLTYRAKAFQEATKRIDDKNHNVMNADKMDANLSILELPEAFHIFENDGPLKYYASIENKKVEELTADEKLKLFNTKYKKETNLCQRQGRCILGCIP